MSYDAWKTSAPDPEPDCRACGDVGCDACDEPPHCERCGNGPGDTYEDGWLCMACFEDVFLCPPSPHTTRLHHAA